MEKIFFFNQEFLRGLVRGGGGLVVNTDLARLHLLYCCKRSGSTLRLVVQTESD